MSNYRVGFERRIRLTVVLNRRVAKATFRADECLFKCPKSRDRVENDMSIIDRLTMGVQIGYL